MSTTINIPDKTFKYPFCYGMISALMIELECELDCAKKYGRPVNTKCLEDMIARYKSVDDALNATFKT
jgi:hypothetical protein